MTTTRPESTASLETLNALVRQYGCGPVRLTGTSDARVHQRLPDRPRCQRTGAAHLAATIDADPAVRGRIKVVFLPEYSVSLAERLIPATDVSNQISTAGYEASGTSNMKFMMNGALTIGTRDGATIEMAEEAGEENFFLFGLSAEQVASSRGWYSPWWHYENQPEVRAALDLIFSDRFSRNEPGVFAPLRATLLTHGDHYMHLADLASYLEADDRLRLLYADRDAWAYNAIINVASAGRFSSDRTIAEYAAEIWRARSCPVL